MSKENHTIFLKVSSSNFIPELQSHDIPECQNKVHLLLFWCLTFNTTSKDLQININQDLTENKLPNHFTLEIEST